MASLFEVWDVLSGNMMACYRTREEAEKLVDECIELGWDRDDIIIDEGETDD